MTPSGRRSVERAGLVLLVRANRDADVRAGRWNGHNVTAGNAYLAA